MNKADGRKRMRTRQRANRLPAEKEFISDAAEHSLAINRVHDHRRLRRKVGYDDGGNYQAPYAPAAVSNGGHWSAAGGCAERDDLMLGLPHPGMRVVCARFSKIISGHPSASRPAILCAIRIH